MQQTNQNQNLLAKYRRRIGYSQKRVAHLIGHKSHGALSSYECGRTLPTLTTALKLEIILRTPVAFLFPGISRHVAKRDSGRGRSAWPEWDNRTCLIIHPGNYDEHSQSGCQEPA